MTQKPYTTIRISRSLFKFNADKSVLNVVLNNGNIYVNKRSAAQTDLTTCSLIRTKKAGGGTTTGGSGQ